MKKQFLLLAVCLCYCARLVYAQTPDNKPNEVVVTAYKTTMLANGKDKTAINITVTDKQGDNVADYKGDIQFSFTGDANIISINGIDTRNKPTDALKGNLLNGKMSLVLEAGKTRSVIKFDAKSEGINKGSVEIHTIQPGVAHPVTSGKPIAGDAKITDKIVGADISFLPQTESRGMKFYNARGQQEDVMKILKDSGFNYIRLRIFTHPEAARGYSPRQGYCDLAHTMAMAKRIKAAGMKLLLDFHYSDTWADPQRQDMPELWSKLDFATLTDSVYTYTKNVMQALKDQGTDPDMVQVGNEINHGMMWPVGAVNNLDSLAKLFYAGVRGVKEVNKNAIIMLHLAVGGQDEEARFFLDNMLKRNVPYDVIGLSYYPKSHGTPNDLKNTMTDLTKRYHKYVLVAEYSQYIEEVNDIAFTAPGDKAVGSFIWEPLGKIFDRQGKPTKYLSAFPVIARKYVSK